MNNWHDAVINFWMRTDECEVYILLSKNHIQTNILKN